MNIKIKNGFLRAKNEFSKFADTEYFIVCLAIFVLIFSFCSWDVAGIIFVSLLYCLVAFFAVNLRALMPVLFMIAYVMSIKNSPMVSADFYLKTSTLIVLIIGGTSMLASSIIALKIRRIKPSITSNFLGIVLLCASLVLGGIFSKGYHIYSMLAGLIISSYFFLPFWLFSSTIKKQDFKYIATSVVAVSVVALLQLVFLYMSNEVLRETLGKDAIILGWGISNAIALVIAVGIPFAIYFMIKTKWTHIWFLCMLALLLGVAFTFSRGVMLVAIPTFIGGVFYGIIALKGKRKLTLSICALFFLAASLIIYFRFDEKIRHFMNFYIESGFDDRGREELYLEAFEVFKSAPLFGTGIFRSIRRGLTFIVFYHNTILQFAAWSGIVGVLALVAHVLLFLRCIIIKPSFERFVILVTFLIIHIHSMLDCVIFYPYMTFIYVMLIAFAENAFRETKGISGNVRLLNVFKKAKGKEVQQESSADIKQG